MGGDQEIVVMKKKNSHSEWGGREGTLGGGGEGIFDSESFKLDGFTTK